jgi:hypothetical protein
MADASRPPPSYPSDWGTAFAALPQEAPPASRWPQIAARLDARARSRRRRLILGLAAGLCALAALPLAWRPREAAPPVAVAGTATAVPATTAPQAPATPSTTTAPQLTTKPVARIHDTSPADLPTDLPSVPTSATGERSPRASAAPRTIAARTTSSAPADRIVTRPWPKAALADDSLESLYATSAQLESLLAVARDPRVESGPAAALGSALDAELATIDAQLSQPGLDAESQRRLWQARVDRLQVAAGFATDQRWLAAHGQVYEGTLVDID